MGLEILQDHIKTVKTSIAFPLRQHKNDAFALELNTAIATLIGHGLNNQMIELLIVRGMIERGNGHSMGLGATAGQEAQEATIAKLDEINKDLSRFADEANLNDAVRKSLNIPATGIDV